MKRFRAFVTPIISVALLLLAGATTARAQVVEFRRVRDAVPGKFFDANHSEPGHVNPNRLNIEFNSGIDLKTLTFNEFRANTLPYGNRTAADAIRFVIAAPDGYFISKVTYIQKGTASTLRGAVQTGTALWTVGAFPSQIANFNNPNLRVSADVSELQRTTLPVAITVSLFAAGSGDIAITDAAVVVELEAFPTPPAPDPIDAPTALTDAATAPADVATAPTADTAAEVTSTP